MISSKQQNLIIDIVSRFNPSMIGIFGSYARGENDQHSDLDILIDFEQPLDLLEIIGEATKQPEQVFRLKYPQIEWKKIAGMRDKLIHDYIGVDLWAVWGVVEKIIPDFHTQIQEIVKKEESGQR